MESPDRRFRVLWTINECLAKAPILFIGDDLEKWGRDVLQILWKLGLCEYWKPIMIGKPDIHLDLLLLTRNDNTISGLESPFCIHRGMSGNYIIEAVITRYVIYSTINDEVEDLLISNFPTFRTKNGGNPKGWREQLRELIRKEEERKEAESAAAELEYKIKRAKEAKGYKNKLNKLKKSLAMHNQEAKRLKKELQDLEQQSGAYTDTEESEMEDSDSEMEDSDSEMGKNKMEDGHSE